MTRTYHHQFISRGLTVMLALSACSRVVTSVEVYNGLLPSQQSRAIERHEGAVKFVDAALSRLMPILAELDDKCALIAPVVEQKQASARDFKREFATKTLPESVAPLFTAVQACIEAPSYDADRCGAVDKAAEALRQANKSHLIAQVKATSIRAQPKREAKEALEKLFSALGTPGELAAAHAKYRETVPKDYRLLVADWRVSTSTEDEELLPTLQSLQAACDEQRPQLRAIAGELDAHQKSLATLAAPRRDPKDRSKAANGQPFAAEHDAYSIHVHIEISELERVRLGVVSTSRATAETIQAALTVIDDAELPRGEFATLALDIKALGIVGDHALQAKVDPTDENIPEITKKENEGNWNKIDVDTLEVRASGRSRHIIVQDSPINFRLKELNSDPTAVVKFGLTAADVGLEVLDAVVTKGAIGTDKGGSQPASSGPSAADKERRARALDEQVKQGRAAILRELEQVERLANEKKPDLAALRARVDGLLEKYESELKLAAQQGSQ